VSNMKYMHLRTGGHYGGVCIAYKRVPLTDSWEYQFAICSLEDRYNKTMARDIAGGRLTGKTSTYYADDKNSMMERALSHCNKKLVKAIESQWKAAYGVFS
jgi:hypothetical protein